MNKRILELATQATTYIDPSANDGVCWNFDKEKFAQLIVRECAWVADTAEPYQTSDLILKHFGVEP